MDEPEIWRLAGALMRQFGREAPLIAEQRADLLLEKGDNGASLDWIRIFRAVEDLSRHRRRPGERLN
jgi:hypothetical protein